MSTQSQYDYDAIIIGAGISGLVCGCYLAKAGLKVLVVEKEDKIGGYCSSFKRGNYKFDVGVHYLGSLKRGILRNVLDDLKINLPTTRIDPTDKIIMPENTTYFRAKHEDTIAEFKKSFPKEEEHIDKFFNFILYNDLLSAYSKIKRLTFKQLLDNFFEDYRIKATLSVPLANIGLSSDIGAAIPCAILFREYLLDSGYYPIGGMQSFANVLGEKLKSLGGHLLLSNKVTKIIMEKPSLKRIVLNNSEEKLSNIVVSSIDATLLFKKLVSVRTKEAKFVNKLSESPSMFLVYLGLKTNIENILKEKSNIWYLSDYNVDKIYSYMSKKVISNNLNFILCSFPSIHDSLPSSNNSTMIIQTLSPYKSTRFWKKYRKEIIVKMISKTEEIIPGLHKFIDLKISATPATLERYTSNKNGAFVGWLATLNQSNSTILPQRTSIRGLYLVGHWTTMGYTGQGGIPSVAFSGKTGAQIILQDLKKKK